MGFAGLGSGGGVGACIGIGGGTPRAPPAAGTADIIGTGGGRLSI